MNTFVYDISVNVFLCQQTKNDAILSQYFFLRFETSQASSRAKKKQWKQRQNKKNSTMIDRRKTAACEWQKKNPKLFPHVYNYSYTTTQNKNKSIQRNVQMKQLVVKEKKIQELNLSHIPHKLLLTILTQGKNQNISTKFLKANFECFRLWTVRFEKIETNFEYLRCWTVRVGKNDCYCIS